MKKFDLQKFYINLPHYLLTVNNQHAEAIKAYGEACDDFALKVKDYRLKKSDKTSHWKKKGEKVTTIRDIVQGETAEEKSELLKAEGRKKMLAMYVDLYKYRNDNYKFIGKGIAYKEKI